MGGTVLSWFVAQHSLLGARWTFMYLVALWVPLWLLAGWAAVRVGPGRLALGLILVFTVTTRLAAATGTTPSISNDLYRYGWDAHVQLSGTDPYRYPPDATQLAHLRTPPWWPTIVGCLHIGDKPGCTAMNRPGDRTIYPAVAESWFALVHLAYPGSSGSTPYQLAGGLVDVATVILLIVAFRRTGRDPRQVAWYALSPIPIIEFAGNGHVDGLALVLLIAALLALERGRRGLAGFLIGLATMVKLYPAIALAAGWRVGRVRMVVVAVLTGVLAELPHLIAVGWKILGYLPGYLKEEHYQNGSRFLLIGIIPLPGRVITVLAIVGVLAAAVWVVRAPVEPGPALAILLTVLILVTTPVQPWYAVTLAGVGAAVGSPWLAMPALAAEPYYAAIVLDDPHQVAVGRICYGLALAGMALAAHLSRGTGRSRPSSPELF